MSAAQYLTCSVVHQGYGGDPLGCGEAGLSIYDWSTFYRKRVIDFNDAQTVNTVTGQPAAFPETSPFVGIRCGGCGADGGFDGDKIECISEQTSAIPQLCPRLPATIAAVCD
eukprot:SAG25_NODE_3360_length_1114_cov_1.980296_1_plen_111_part_10